MSLATHSHPPPFILTIAHALASSTTRKKGHDRAQWRLRIFGSWTLMPRDNLVFIYIQGRKTLETTHPRPTPAQSIGMYAPTTYILINPQGSCQEPHLPALGEGVLKPWPIPTTIESHYPGSQDTESWIGKHNSLVSLTQYKTYLHKLHNSPIW